MASNWPQDWAARGDLHSTKRHDPAKDMSLAFRAIIEGSHYERKVDYIPVSEQPAEGEKLAVIYHTEGYPSGGSAEYAAHTYWDGLRWHDDGEWRSSQYKIIDPRVQWFLVSEQS